MNNFDWNDYLVAKQDDGSCFDIADDCQPVAHLGDFVPELEMELDYDS